MWVAASTCEAMGLDIGAHKSVPAAPVDDLLTLWTVQPLIPSQGPSRLRSGVPRANVVDDLKYQLGNADEGTRPASDLVDQPAALAYLFVLLFMASGLAYLANQDRKIAARREESLRELEEQAAVLREQGLEEQAAVLVRRYVCFLRAMLARRACGTSDVSTVLNHLPPVHLRTSIHETPPSSSSPSVFDLTQYFLIFFALFLIHDIAFSFLVAFAFFDSFDDSIQSFATFLERNFCDQR